MADFSFSQTLGTSNLTIDDVRSRLSGFHFAQEAIDAQARQVLRLAEAVLAEVDRLYGGYAKVLLSDEQAAEVAKLVRRLLLGEPDPV